MIDRWLQNAARAALLAVLGAAGGCATVTTGDGDRLRIGSAEFRDYAERVFRLQNRVATDLAFALEEAEIRGEDPPERLVAAEERLLEACAGLNEVAALRRDQQRIGPRRGAAAARTAPRCEAAAEAAAAALKP